MAQRLTGETLNLRAPFGITPQGRWFDHRKGAHVGARWEVSFLWRYITPSPLDRFSHLKKRLGNPGRFACEIPWLKTQAMGSSNCYADMLVRSGLLLA